MSCCASAGCDAHFTEQQAARDLQRYRDKGPDKTTRLLLRALRNAGVRGASLLDVGGGIGVVHQELLDAGAASAVHVDAAAAYVHTAREESARRGYGDRVRFLHGDFVALADALSAADIVTLDRVICCYPEMEPLVAASASRARRLYGVVVPRDNWLSRLAFAVSNQVRRLRGNAFRTYLHSPALIDAAIRRRGLTLTFLCDTIIWRVAVYAR